MVNDVLILNRLDLTFRKGLYLDIELCKLYRANCYFIITAITKNDSIILRYNNEDIIREVKNLDIERFKAIRLDIASGLEVVKVLSDYLNKFYVKVLTINPNLTSENLLKDSLEYLSKNVIFQRTDVLVLDLEDIKLIPFFSISSEEPYRFFKYLSSMLGINNLLLLNRIDGEGFTHEFYSDDVLLELSTSLEVPKDFVATYIAIRLTNSEGLNAVINDAIGLAEKSLRYAVKCYDYILPEVYIEEIVDAEKYRVIRELGKAVKALEENHQLVVDLIPEVQMNLAYALPKHLMSGVGDVAAFPGRIVKVSNTIKTITQPEFGVSKHLARALIKVMEFNPAIRAIGNVKYHDLILKAIKELGYTVSFYDRTQEPPEVKSVEGATIPWGVSEAVKKVGHVPDIIYHKGDYGKEAMILILGRKPDDVVNKVLNIGRTLRKYMYVES